MSRSMDILSRVYRNLRKYGISHNDLQDEEVFDEMTLAQDRIISEIFPDRIITITLVEGQDTYSLTTDDIGSLTPGESERINIASVKIIKLPIGWGNSGLSDFNINGLSLSGFNIIPNNRFIEIVNANQERTGRPQIGHIVNNKLQVYPVPTSEENGQEIQLYVYISSSAGIIDAENEPELRNDFDKAIEYFATAQFLAGKERVEYMNEFMIEVKRLAPIQNRKHHNLTRPPIGGFIG